MIELLEMDNLLGICDLYVEYKSGRSRVFALNGLSLTIGKGEALGLVGESGAGKTTTALSILKLLPQSSAIVREGEIMYKGCDLLKESEKNLMKIRGKKIAMVFQNPLTSLNPVFTIGEQIGMALVAHEKISASEALGEAEKLLEIVGIPKYRIGEYPNQFSGGMRQRVGIAAALACHPELLIADEPTTALDVTIQAQILELIRDLQNKYKMSLLMITHNLGIVRELCKNVAVMYAGTVIEWGTVREVFKNPAHPYTRGLLASIPKLRGLRETLAIIPGQVADAMKIPPGCAFQPRCENVMANCSSIRPTSITLSMEHRVSCHLYGG